MTKPNPDAPAFPVADFGESGMTLREYYAGQMMAGNLANPESAGSCADFAAYAVELADALIAELGKDKT